MYEIRRPEINEIFCLIFVLYFHSDTKNFLFHVFVQSTARQTIHFCSNITYAPVQRNNIRQCVA